MFNFLRFNNQEEIEEENNLFSRFFVNPFITKKEEDFNLGTYFELSWTTRIYGFGICLATGIVFSLVGSIMLFFLNFVAFGVLYSLGNIISIFASLFVVGPMRQLKSMFNKKRIIITILLLLSIILTLVCAFVAKKAGLCILSLIFQIIMYIWYVLTYIPGGQTMCLTCMKTTSSTIINL